MANLPFSIESLFPHLKSTNQVYSVAQGNPPVVDLPTSNETSLNRTESRRPRLLSTADAMARVTELEKLNSGLRKENHNLARELENVKIPKCFRNASTQTEAIGFPDSKKRKTVDESELIDVMAV